MPEMRIKAAILDGDKGLRQVGRQIRQIRTAAPPVSPRLASKAPFSSRMAMFGGRFGTARASIGGSFVA